jgi:hypothetical protein
LGFLGIFLFKIQRRKEHDYSDEEGINQKAV